MNWSTRLRRWVRIRTPPVPGRLDEADRGDGLAGAGRVLEPEAALGAGVLGRLLDDLLVLLGGLFLPVLRLLVGRELLVLLVGSSSPRRLAVGAGGAGSSPASPLPLPLPARRRRRRSAAGPSARPACRRERRPGAGSVRRRRAASAVRRRASARARAAARSPAATRSRGTRRLRRAPSAPRRGRAGGRSPGPAPPAPRRRAGRARGRTAAARSMSALEGTAASAATSLVLAIEGFRASVPAAHRRVRAGTSERGCGGSTGVPPTYSARSASREPNVRIVPMERMRARIGPLPGACRRWRWRSLLGSGCGRLARAATTAAPTPTTRRRWPGRRRRSRRSTSKANELLDGGHDAFEKRIAAAARLPGRRQRLGLLVRPLPAGVPDPAEALGARTASRSPSSASTPKTPTTPPPPSSARSRCPTPATPTPTKRSPTRSAPRRLPRHRLLRPLRRARLPQTRALTATNPNWKPTFAATPLQSG